MSLAVAAILWFGICWFVNFCAELIDAATGANRG